MVNVMLPNKTRCVSTQSAKMFSGAEGNTPKESVNSQKSSDNPNWFVGYVGETQKGIPQEGVPMLLQTVRYMLGRL